MALGAVTGTIPVAPKWAAGFNYATRGHYTIGAAVAQNDTITFTDLLIKGSQFVDLEIVVTAELDTNASPTGTMDVGTAADPDMFIDGLLIGGAATPNGELVFKPNVTTAFGTIFTADTSLVITLPTAVATAASAGLVTVRYDYYCIG